MNSSMDANIEQEQTKDFLKASRDFCAFIESIDKSDDTYLRQLQTLLLTLYQRATVLPWIESEFSQEFEVNIPEGYIKNILKSLSDRIGANRYYWTVFDPTDDTDKEAVCGDLVDDIGDVYHDVKRGLLIFDIGTIGSKEVALWHLKFLFEKHWGKHTIDALRTLHFLLEE